MQPDARALSMDEVGRRYLRRLSAGDLSLLARVAGTHVVALQTNPSVLVRLLSSTAVRELVLPIKGVEPSGQPSMSSPFLVFSECAEHRLFLAELLTSFNRVASGAYLQRTSRGWRRLRYSELDPVRLAGLLDVVPAAERAVVYRRLADWPCSSPVSFLTIRPGTGCGTSMPPGSRGPRG